MNKKIMYPYFVTSTKQLMIYYWSCLGHMILDFMYLSVISYLFIILLISNSPFFLTTILDDYYLLGRKKEFPFLVLELERQGAQRVLQTWTWNKSQRTYAVTLVKVLQLRIKLSYGIWSIIDIGIESPKPDFIVYTIINLPVLIDGEYIEWIIVSLTMLLRLCEL